MPARQTGLPARTPSRARKKPEAGGRTEKEIGDNARLAAYCRALSQPVRLRLLKLLLQEHCMFADLARHIPLAQSTISQHLKILAEAGIVDTEVVGLRTCFCVNEKEIERMRKMLASI